MYKRQVQTTGIWKTVWLETAASSYLKSAKITPNVQAAAVEIEFEVEAKNCEDCILEICVSFGETVVSTTTVDVYKRQALGKLCGSHFSHDGWI